MAQTEFSRVVSRIAREIAELSNRAVDNSEISTAYKSWSIRIQEAGYSVVNATGVTQEQWQDCHAWLKAEIGTQNYTWSGMVFFFANENDAFAFKLKWT